MGAVFLLVTFALAVACAWWERAQAEKLFEEQRAAWQERERLERLLEERRAAFLRGQVRHLKAGLRR
jgi:hypothetical protein